MNGTWMCSRITYHIGSSSKVYLISTEKARGLSETVGKTRKFYALFEIFVQRGVAISLSLWYHITREIITAATDAAWNDEVRLNEL